jgi:hypothetical protein
MNWMGYKLLLFPISQFSTMLNCLIPLSEPKSLELHNTDEKSFAIVKKFEQLYSTKDYELYVGTYRVNKVHFLRRWLSRLKFVTVFFNIQI